MANTKAIIRHAILENVKMTLVVNKIDRLILELRIKPADAYYKIKHTIEEVNTYIRFALKAIIGILLGLCRISTLNPDPELRLTPERGNVAFASTDMAWCFTLRSFAQMYADSFGSLSQSASTLMGLKDSLQVHSMFAVSRTVYGVISSSTTRTGSSRANKQILNKIGHSYISSWNLCTNSIARWSAKRRTTFGKLWSR